MWRSAVGCVLQEEDYDLQRRNLNHLTTARASFDLFIVYLAIP
jgi:hypothetical protein